LNIGPMPSGEIQPEFVTTLHAMGAWLEAHGDAIHATRGGPFPPGPWGVSTQQADRIYVHVLDWNAAVLALPAPPRRVRAAHTLGNRAVEFRQDRFGLQLRLMQPIDPVDEIVVLELAPAR